LCSSAVGGSLGAGGGLAALLPQGLVRARPCLIGRYHDLSFSVVVLRFAPAGMRVVSPLIPARFLTCARGGGRGVAARAVGRRPICNRQLLCGLLGAGGGLAALLPQGLVRARPCLTRGVEQCRDFSFSVVVLHFAPAGGCVLVKKPWSLTHQVISAK
jgi:hypothetical protein